MTHDPIEQIADAILYEGYLLYPYRPSSLKNQQRWNFGGLCPRAYSEAQNGTEAWRSRTECLAVAERAATLRIKLRFLHLIDRRCARLRPGAKGIGECFESDLEFVEALDIDGEHIGRWQEARTEEVELPEMTVDLSGQSAPIPRFTPFSLRPSRTVEALRDSRGKVTGAFVREQSAIEAGARVAVERFEGPLCKLTLEILNLTEFPAAARAKRDEAMMYSLVSSHAILRIEGGEFVSMLEPAPQYATFVSRCENVGTYPVLAGPENQRRTLLSSPVILYDYPKVAAESAGELFDGTEIDEILTLRILAMTDTEKAEMRRCDERARRILERIEAHPEHLQQLHGIIRGAETPRGGPA